jgi:Tol biopolymer transport system component
LVETTAAAVETSVAETTVVPVAPAKPTDGYIVYGWGAPCGTDSPGPGLCLVREDGSDAHPILAELGELTDPDWSHDGTSIVFVNKQILGQLWVTDANGTAPRPVIADASRCASEARTPAWSPDDTRIAFMCLNGSKTEIAIVDVATGVVSSVYKAAAHEESWNPRWSPDGSQLVFERDSFDGDTIIGGEIVVIPVGGGAVTVVAPSTLLAGWPDWSPNDDLIVFETNGISVFETGGPGATNLYTVRADGSQLTQLTMNEKGGDRDSQPSFTPDGRRIIHTHVTGYSRGGRGLRHASFIALDGTDRAVVDTVFATHPRLRPVPPFG